MDGKPWLSWDMNEIVEEHVKTEMEDRKDNPHLYDEEKDEETLRKDLWGDEDFFQIAWDGLLEELTEWMNGHHSYRCEVENYGRRKLNGQTLLQLREPVGAALLSMVLPHTSCTFNIWRAKDRLSIQNFHYDSPTGDERYTVIKE